jgi:CRISPR-associated protein Cas1
MQMTERIIDISEQGVNLHIKNKQLMLTMPDGGQESMPLDDVGVLVASHPNISYTQSVLSTLLEQGGSFVACSRNCMPVGMLLPIESNYIQTERMALQASASVPCKKRIWQQIIKAKVKSQGELLKTLYKDDEGLLGLAEKVKSGDVGNVEAQAARRYWSKLFNDSSFRRNRDAEDQNRFLNYGYAILRAIVARGLCATGLHPSLGVHHHNRYNAFCLADDVMEPMRAIVDKVVVEYTKDWGVKAPLDNSVKRMLIGTLQEKFLYNKEKRNLFDITNRIGSSLVACFNGEKTNIMFPEKT